MSKRLLAIGALVIVFGATAVVAVSLWPEREPGTRAGAEIASAAGSVKGEGGGAEAEAESSPGGSSGHSGPPSRRRGSLPERAAEGTRFALQPIPGELPIRPRFKRPPAAGLLFDVDTGEVLWARNEAAPFPIASLTKLMTALLIAERHRPGERVLISRKASRSVGSATGLLPRGRRVPLGPLLQALIMISANDAAVALAEHDSGTTAAFISLMNRRVRKMGLACTHFSTPNGLRDRGNYACPLDLAALARAALAEPPIARIAATPRAKPRFPIKGKRLHLANNHYFLRRGIPGVRGAEVTGLKTGFTDGAGRCYITTARLGSTHLGAIVLDSPDPIKQVPRLLRAGFRESAVGPGS